MNDKENTEPQKPFNDHTPLPCDHQVCENRDPFGSSISHDLHHEDGDGFSFVAEFSNEDDAMFARHACNTYYDTIAARSKDKERIEALQASLLDVAEKSTARIAALEAGLMSCSLACPPRNRIRVGMVSTSYFCAST